MTPDITVIIPTRGKSEMLHGAIRSVIFDARDSALNVQLVVVDHEPVEGDDSIVKVINDTAGPIDGDKVIYKAAFDRDAEATAHAGGKWSYASLNNWGAMEAKAPALLLLNNDTIVRPGALRAMLRVLHEKPDVGIVGAKLLFPDRRIQHIGVVVDRYGIPSHIGHGRMDGEGFETAERSDYYHAVTFACAMIRKGLWDALCGLDTDYYFNYEDTDFCLRAAELKQRSYVEMKATVTHLEGGSSEHRRTKEHSVERNYRVFEKKWLENKRIEGVLGRGYVAGEAERRYHTKVGPAVVTFPSSKDAGVSWWRMLLPAKKIIQKRLMNLVEVHAQQAAQSIISIVDRCDLAVWQGHYNEPLHQMAAMRDLRAHRMIYEIDDHPVYLSPYCEVYRTLGTKEIKLRAKNGDEEWLWRDGQCGFDLERNRTNIQRQLEIINLVDAVTTTTPELKRYLSTLNPNVHVLPNCIDFAYYPDMGQRFVPRAGRKLRIGWWGGDNHFHDIETIGKSLAQFVNENDVELVLMGSFYRGAMPGIDQNKVVEVGWAHVEAFPFILGHLGLDIVFIPLASPAMKETRFNAFKSDIKWLEAAAYRLPSVVSANQPAYQNCVDRENALTFVDGDEFYEKMQELVDDHELRARIGNAAYDWAREHRNLDKEIHRWVQCYEETAKMQQAIDKKWEDELRPAGSSSVAEGVGA